MSRRALVLCPIGRRGSRGSTGAWSSMGCDGLAWWMEPACLAVAVLAAWRACPIQINCNYTIFFKSKIRFSRALHITWLLNKLPFCCLFTKFVKFCLFVLLFAHSYQFLYLVVCRAVVPSGTGVGPWGGLVVAGGNRYRHCDNLWCRRRWEAWCGDGSRFSAINLRCTV